MHRHLRARPPAKALQALVHLFIARFALKVLRSYAARLSKREAGERGKPPELLPSKRNARYPRTLGKGSRSTSAGGSVMGLSASEHSSSAFRSTRKSGNIVNLAIYLGHHPHERVDNRSAYIFLDSRRMRSSCSLVNVVGKSRRVLLCRFRDVNLEH